MVLAFASTSPPSFSPRALGGAARGLPIHAIATPQPAIAQLLSTCAASENSLMAASSQNECSMATPRRKCSWAAGVHDVWKLTLPSCSVAAPVTWDRATDAGRNKTTTSVTMRGMRFMAGPPYAGESTIRRRPLESGTLVRHLVGPEQQGEAFENIAHLAAAEDSDAADEPRAIDGSDLRDIDDTRPRQSCFTLAQAHIARHRREPKVRSDRGDDRRGDGAAIEAVV